MEMQQCYDTIVVDDERPVRVFTRYVLEKFRHVFNIVAEASSGEEAVEKINAHQPHVVFLDVRMPCMNGFQVLEKLNCTPVIVFLTAYDNYAVKAFDENSIDYLLKPLQEDRLLKTIEKINHYHKSERPTISPRKLRQFQDAEYGQPELTALNRTITVKYGNKILLLPFEEVVALQSRDKYTFIKMLDGKEYLDNRTLTELENILPHNFMRIQKGAIINTAQVLKLNKHINNRFHFHLKDTASTVLLSGHTYVQKIRDWLENA